MSSYVYMIRAGDRCKIGKADNPEARIHSFRTGCPYPIETLGTIKVQDARAALELEGYLHFTGTQWGLHRDREWFEYHPGLEAKFLAQGATRRTEGERFDTSTLQAILGAIMTGGATIRPGMKVVIDVSDFLCWIPSGVPELTLHFVEHPEVDADCGIICDPTWMGDHPRPIAVCEYMYADEIEAPEDEIWTYNFAGTWVSMPLSRLGRVHELLGMPGPDFSDSEGEGAGLDIRDEVESILGGQS